MLSAAKAAGEPCVLTLRQLRRHEPPIAAGLVRICENPVVVAAAADELGPACPPLVCGDGRPSAAVWRLLELLARGGAEFAYHGDGSIVCCGEVPHLRRPGSTRRCDAADRVCVCLVPGSASAGWRERRSTGEPSDPYVDKIWAASSATLRFQPWTAGMSQAHPITRRWCRHGAGP
ncbi:DUF2399 domain-containing protein [Nonomuraea wenchangensis]|uniref:DUF2399 domain-containing protein n=1 Tax=Nonomuraea wenchangensis TaxID=568860 RepID=UPI0034420389